MARNHGYAYRELIDASGEGRTAFDFLSQTYDRASPTDWSQRFSSGEVLINGDRANPEDKLQRGQTLTWNRPPWNEPDVPMNWALLHEDDALIAANKPSGLPTLPGAGFLESTLLAQVRQRFPEASPLHRLGRHTSGIVLFARTTSAASRLSEAFRQHALNKQYLAVASGVAAFNELHITTPIGPVPHPLLGTVHASSPSGKPAQSVATVIERRATETLLCVRIHTGRPHQIRIHLASVGHPLVGDPLYEPGGLPAKQSTAVPGDGGYLLHAERLTFVHPVSGQRIELRAAPPGDTKARFTVTNR